MGQVLENLFDFIFLLFLNPIEIKKFRVQGFKNHFDFHISMLNFTYCFFSLIFAFYTFTSYESFVINMGIFLHFVQTIVPVLMLFYLSIDFLKKSKLELRLKVRKFIGDNKESSSKTKILAFLLLLLAVRAIKLFVAPFLTNFFLRIVYYDAWACCLNEWLYFCVLRWQLDTSN